MSIVVSTDFVLGGAPSVPLSYPRILYDDIWSAGTITASSEGSNTEATNVADGMTWDFWRPTSLPATISIQTVSGVEVDYALIAAHDLGTNEVSIKVQYFNGSTWADLTAEYLPGDDKVFAFLFDQVTASQFRLSLNGDNSPEQLPSIGVVMMGKALAMQRGIPLNHIPVSMAGKTTIKPQISEGGRLLGRSIRREGVKTKIEFQYLTADWVRVNFLPFIEHARTRPFGWIWSPSDFSADVGLLWTPSGKEDIRPVYAGVQNRMHVSFEVEGIII